MSDQPLADDLYAKALELARERSAAWRESERQAGEELERLAGSSVAAGDAEEALRVARDRLAEELMGDAEVNPDRVLAHRLLQLALAPGQSPD